MILNFLEVLYDNETLETERLLLRRFQKRDAADVYAYASDPQTLKYLCWDGVHSLEEAKQAIIGYYWSKPGIYAIEYRESGRCIGCIDLRVVQEHEKASFGYMLAREYWGQGLMTEALGVLLWLCFEKLELHRVESTHHVGNEGSGKVMEKCGMRREGMATQELKIKGVFQDVVHYGILREEWQVRRG